MMKKKCPSNIMSCTYRDVFGKVGEGVREKVDALFGPSHGNRQGGPR